jgi:hypothetical protein
MSRQPVPECVARRGILSRRDIDELQKSWIPNKVKASLFEKDDFKGNKVIDKE